MAKKEAKPEEAPPQSVGDWIVTFSDCMTLLLCFFVLLLTFSSFDEVALQRFDGVFDYDPGESSFEARRKVLDTNTEQPELIDQAKDGSETPTDPDQEANADPPDTAWIPDSSAYSDRRVVYIPSRHLFAASAAALTGRGRQCLAMIARHMRQIPSRVIVSESSTGHRGSLGLGLERSWTIMQYFIGRHGLPRSRFNISATRLMSATTAQGEDIVEIVLLARDVYR